MVLTLQWAQVLRTQSRLRNTEDWDVKMRGIKFHEQDVWSGHLPAPQERASNSRGRYTRDGDTINLIGFLWEYMGFPGGSVSKESACNEGDLGFIPGLGRSPGEGKGYPLQRSCLENSMDCIGHGFAKSWTWLSDSHFHFPWEINPWK